MALALAPAVAIAASSAPARPDAHVDVDHGDPAAGFVISAPSSDFIVGPSISGSWYDPQRNGEGFLVHMFRDGSVLAVWYTYPPAGVAGEQAWMYGLTQDVDGDRIRFDAVVRPVGGRFGAGFDSADVTQPHWGTFEFEFVDCTRAVVRYDGPEAFGSGEIALSRLTAPQDVGCDGPQRLTTGGARSRDGLRGTSGTWYDLARSGEGYTVEEIFDGSTGVYWFTFDEEGAQRWIFGVGERVDAGVRIDRAYRTRGARFGAAFRSEDVELLDFGTIGLSGMTCSSGDLAYNGTVSGLGAASRSIHQLTRVAGVPCIDGTPTIASNAGWQARSPMPAPATSEHDSAPLGERIHLVGGFGGGTSHRSYDPATDSWNTLAPMPDGRDHLAVFAIGASLYAAGGGSDGSGPRPVASGYRFDAGVDGGTWTAMPALPFVFGSRAAVLHGRAYIGDESGALYEYHPVSGRITAIPSAALPGVAREHSQVVAFNDEIWMLGGRSPDHSAVAIFNPASRRWRRGPAFAFARGGFAAAADETRIVLTGGERFATQASTVPQTEAFVAGDAAWRRLPDLPLAVHGTAGAIAQQGFFVFGGSTLAGSANGRVADVWRLDLGPPTRPADADADEVRR